MEKRAYSRINTKINGTLYKENVEIPVTICDLSEKGIGIRYKYKDCPVDFTIVRGDEFTVTFFDEISFGNTANVQVCTFKVVQARIHSSHSYIGAKLVNDEYGYSEYVKNKKITKFIGAIRFTGLAQPAAI